MKKVEELIQKVKDGKVAILNDGTIEQLREVLGCLFPNDLSKVKGNCKFYVATEVKGLWYSDNFTCLPIVSVKKFYEDEFVWGEEVEVRDYEIWENAKFIGKNPNAISDMNICITLRNTIVNIGMSNIRKSPTKLKLTHQMIADKFGVGLGTFEIVN